VLTAEQLVKRLIWLIPPARLHLTNFHGVFASHSKARSALLPRAASAEAKEKTTPYQSPSPGVSPPTEVKRPRLDWATLYARTWGIDVWKCRCGGKRKVLAVATSRRTAGRNAAAPRSSQTAAAIARGAIASANRAGRLRCDEELRHQALASCAGQAEVRPPPSHHRSPKSSQDVPSASPR